jgi:hypothetical protein
MNKNEFLIVGLPQSGKTTFLAALSHVVLSRDVPNSLQYNGLDDKRDYIRYIKDQWLSAERIERTTLSTEETVILKAKTPDNKVEMELNIPDFFGETYRDQWEKRHATKLFDNVAKSATGAVFLIHSQKIKNPVSIGELQTDLNIIAAAEGTLDNQEPISEDQLPETEPWSPATSPSQVIFVDLLQTLISYGISKIAIVISAWDAVSEDIPPKEWIKNHLPLLNQFLKANSDELEVKIYGISAQGGNYDDPDKKQELMDMDPASDRIVVREDEDTSNDITLPLKWLMGL